MSGCDSIGFSSNPEEADEADLDDELDDDDEDLDGDFFLRSSYDGEFRLLCLSYLSLASLGLLSYLSLSRFLSLLRSLLLSLLRDYL